MTADAIKTALSRGIRVFWVNRGYEVVRDCLGQYLIRFAPTGDCIGLTWNDGRTLNGDESEFFESS